MITPRIRTINSAYTTIKDSDPETSLTLHALRRAVLSGEIPSRRSGAKYLVDVDRVLGWLRGQRSALEVVSGGVVRRSAIYE